MNSKRLGFIGAGNLAQPLISHLLEAGYTLYLYNRTASRLAPFANNAQICSSPAELCQQVDLVFSLIADDDALLQITERPTGILSSLSPGGIHVSMSTVSPAIIQRLHQAHQQKGNILLSAPIMGRPEAARAKAIYMCMAGDSSAKARVEPIFRDMGARQVFDYGEHPAHANVAKLGINFLLAAAMEAMAEAYRLVSSFGVKPEQFYQMFSQTLFNCPAYQGYGKLILDQKYDDTQFSAKLGLKDIRLVQQTAAAQQLELPLSIPIAQHLQQAIDRGWAEKDWSVFTAIAMGNHKP
ncbi:MAG: NAD(P)-dependent oxidoreductase [Thermoflavifilum sp.]|nr:NAD(P)-dependent oxidoreductase [Thermoflavifilum sp.]